MAPRSARSFLVVFAALGACSALAQPCPTGRVITNDTLGHCCWPGQVYAASRGVCIGVPTVCPSGFEPKGETCEQACPPGQKVGPDTHGVCCWPGQAYSLARRSCVGVPTECPTGLAVSGETCIEAPPGMMPEPMPTPRQPRNEPPPPPPPLDGPPPPPLLGTDAPPPRPPGPAPTTPPPRPEPTLKPPGPVPLDAPLKPPPEPQVSGAPEEPGKPPKRNRVAFTTGLFLGPGTGGAIGLPMRIGVYTVNSGESLQGVAAIAIEPWVFASWRTTSGVNYLGLGAGLNLAAGWEQRLGPIELFPRLGVAAIVAYQGAVSGGGGANAVDLLVRALFGLRFAVPAREGSRFVVGIDYYAGANSLTVIYIGVGF